MNVECDRLSSLPDDIIHKILALNGAKKAIRTSALSSRWRYTWTSMPCLSFSSEDFHTYSKFSQFIRYVLSKGKNQLDVHSISVSFHDTVSHALVKRIIDFAISHNVQQLSITWLRRKFLEFPFSAFCSQFLKHLTLSGFFILTLPAWEATALATLDLHKAALRDGVFSNCANLKNLILKSCNMMSSNDFNICHPGLTSLTLEGGSGCKGINVITPQLKHPSITSSPIHLVSAPNLYSLHYGGGNLSFEFSTDLLHLETVDICAQCSREDKEHKFVCLLQKLCNVKFLTLNLEFVKFLASVELISRLPSPFSNLKSLKIYPYYVSLNEQARPEVTMSYEVKEYLLDASPGATITMVSHEEAKTVKNIVLACMFMRELQVLLYQWKENSETNTTRLMQGKAPMEVKNQLATERKWHFWLRMTDNNEQFAKMYKSIVSIVQETEGILTKIPTSSHQSKLKLSFSRLCVDVETLMDDMADYVKIQCAKKPRLYVHQPATASQPSS
ncbi:F-box protein At5g03100-like [Bidens hawaiensis]|uniref:F-box protein At5g03100-like n=1 Tax=Bidens hawaiensis TaxID=980011 RepID=UPI0040495985